MKPEEMVALLQEYNGLLDQLEKLFKKTSSLKPEDADYILMVAYVGQLKAASARHESSKSEGDRRSFAEYLREVAEMTEKTNKEKGGEEDGEG